FDFFSQIGHTGMVEPGLHSWKYGLLSLAALEVHHVESRLVFVLRAGSDDGRRCRIRDTVWNRPDGWQVRGGRTAENARGSSQPPTPRAGVVGDDSSHGRS